MAENKTLLSRLVAAPEEGTVRYPLWRIVFGPYMIFIDNFRPFFFIGGLYALIMSVLYLLGGQSLFCSYSNFTAQEICSANIWWYAGTRLAVLFVIGAFCVRYYQAVWQKQPLSWSYLLKPRKTDACSFAAFVVFLLLNAVSGLSWYLLSVRVPNPDWRIELTYFAFVALGFVVPFVLLRFYGVFAYLWNCEKIPSLWQIWQKSRGNGLRLILSLALWFFLFVFALLSVSVNFNLAAGDNPFYIVIAGEYVFNLVVLILISFFINFCGLQKLFLSEGEIHDRAKSN